MIIEAILLFSMFATLFISSEFSAIAVWHEVNPLVFLRVIVWFLGLLLLPGIYVVRLTKIAVSLSRLEKAALGINLSLALIGLSAIVFYGILGSLVYFEWFNLIIVTMLGSLYWSRHFNDARNSELHFSKWDGVLLVTVLASFVLALLVQVAQMFLIPGDLWLNLQPGVSIIAQRNMSESFTAQYPIAFGFILAGLSVCSGLPVVNVFVLMFPLVALNIVSFYVLVKVVFARSAKISTIASVIYAFGGGLAWIAQAAIFEGSASLWTLSQSTQDIFFAMPFWNTMEFSHRTLALTLTYSSATMFAVSYRLKEKIREFSAVTLSSALLLFSFLIHMIEIIVCVPMIVAIAYVYRKKRKNLANLGVLALSSLLLAFVVDVSTSQYYYWLIFVKLGRFLSTIRAEYVLLYSLSTAIVLPLAVLTYRPLRKRASLVQKQERRLEHLKLLLLIGLSAIYLSGIFFITSTSDSGISSPFAWYLYITRYGFIGILAIIGLVATDWKESWFVVAATWSVIIIAIGSVWWGTRVNSYLFPMFALLAAVGTDALWQKAHNTMYITITTARNQTGKRLRISLKPIMATMLITTITLSFVSFIYGASYYATNGPSLDDDAVRILQWISKNTPQNAAILVPNSYNIYKSVSTIADRRIYLDTNLPTTVDATSFTNLTYTLQTNNIQYALTTASISQQNYMVDLLIAYSPLAYQAGENRIYKLPQLTPPTPNSDLAVVDKETLGLPDTTNFAWLDDSFTSNWTYKSVNATSDGEVITYEWTFRTNSTQEPSMKAKIVPKNTNAYPYLIINYRNTQETTTTAENNIGQIITLINSTGYPKGFFKNIYLPISKQNTFSIFTTKLPENQEVAEIWIWMRNYEKLNGTVDLQIDYMGLSSDENIPQNPTNIRFIASIIPSMWQTNYSIFQEYDQVQGAKTIVTTYSKDIYNKILERTDTSIFVLFNRTITLPSWGIGWQNVDANVATGYVENKKIILCRTEGINQENIVAVAENIYQQIQD